MSPAKQDCVEVLELDRDCSRESIGETTKHRNICNARCEPSTASLDAHEILAVHQHPNLGQEQWERARALGSNKHR